MLEENNFVKSYMLSWVCRLLTDARLFEPVPTVEIPCVELHDLFQPVRLVLVQRDRIAVQLVLLRVRLELVERIQLVKMPNCLHPPAEIVVDGELATELFHLLEALQVRKVLPGIFLRLLRNEKRYVEVVHSERVIVKLVDVCEEANVFSCPLCQAGVLLSKLCDDTKSTFKVGGSLANICCDDVLKICLCALLKNCEESVTDPVDLGRDIES